MTWGNTVNPLRSGVISSPETRAAGTGSAHTVCQIPDAGV